jgi:4-amino-4-deoxy-L-arabinose transferase-like glycosyltransferase
MRGLTMPAVTLGRWRAEGVRVSGVAFAVGALTLAGLALRLAWVLYVDTIPLGGDPHWYYVVGINLAQGYGFVASANELFEVPGPGEPTAFWSPAYPFALAGIFKLFGVSITAAKVANAIFGALTVPFVFALGHALFGRRAGLGGAAIFALFPNAIAWTPLLFPEQLFTLLFVVALWLLVAFPVAGRGGWRAAAALGALIALATLTRGQGAVLLPVAVVYWLMRWGWRPAAQATAVSLVAAAIVITPWTVRNAVELHAFIPISTNSAAAIRAGHAPDSTGTTKWTSDRVNGVPMWEMMRDPTWEVASYREYTKRGIAYAFTHPTRELQLTGWKIYHTYRTDSDVVPWLTTLGATPIESHGLEEALPRVFDVSYYALLFAAVLSVPLCPRRDANAALLINVVLMWTLFHIAFLGEPRYHVPLYPAFALAVAAGASMLGGVVGGVVGGGGRAGARVRAHTG